MYIFYITLLITFFLSLMARITKNKFNKPNLLITIIIIGVLVLVSGLRNNIGDTGAYKILYKNISVNALLPAGSYETGFILFLTLLNNLSNDPQFMLFITALITNGLNVWVFRKYASLYELQTYMYITSGYYLVTMNGIRQALVAAILFASTKFITEGKFIVYLLITAAMYTFHTSALIMIPVYFLVRQEVWSRKTMILLLTLPIIFLFFQPIMSFMFKTLEAEGARYASYEQDIMTGGEGGANVFRVVIASVPVVMAYFGRHKLKKEWPESNVFVSMSLINLIVMMFSLYNWLFARFELYFQPYAFILLPYMINTLFKQKKLLYSLFIIFYFIFFYYEQAITLRINYMSNFF